MYDVFLSQIEAILARQTALLQLCRTHIKITIWKRYRASFTLAISPLAIRKKFSSNENMAPTEKFPFIICSYAM